MSKKVAVLQSCYIPWKGYFDIIRSVDEFILYDDAQYTKRDWRNRNLIQTPNGLQWLTIPVNVSGRFTQRIREVTVSDPTWAEKHWKALAQNYAKARCFSDYGPFIEKLYLSRHEALLSDINYAFICGICQLLEIGTKLSWSMDYGLPGERSERLASMCAQAGASVYISGPAARAYLDESAFARRGMEVRYVSYAGYREYKQLYAPFAHGVTILDLLFNEGVGASEFMRPELDLVSGGSCAG